MMKNVLAGMLGCLLTACAVTPTVTDPTDTTGNTGKVKVALALINSQNVDEHIADKGIAGSLSPHEKNALRFACGGRDGWLPPPRPPRHGAVAAIPPFLVGILANLATGLVNRAVDHGVERISRALAAELEKYTAAYDAGASFNFFEDAPQGSDLPTSPVVRYPCYRFSRMTQDPENSGWTTQLDVIGQFAFRTLEDGTVLPQVKTRVLRVYYAEPVAESEAATVQETGEPRRMRPIALSLALSLTSNWWIPEEHGSFGIFTDHTLFVDKFHFPEEGDVDPRRQLIQLDIVDNPVHDAANPHSGPVKIYDPDQGWRYATGGMPMLTIAPWIEEHRRIGMVVLKVTAAEVGQPDAGLETLAGLFEEHKEALAEAAKTRFGAAVEMMLR